MAAWYSAVGGWRDPRPVTQARQRGQYSSVRISTGPFCVDISRSSQHLHELKKRSFLLGYLHGIAIRVVASHPILLSEPFNRPGGRESDRSASQPTSSQSYRGPRDRRFEAGA